MLSVSLLHAPLGNAPKLALCPAAALGLWFRPDYMTTFVEHLINWDNVAKRFEAATA